MKTALVISPHADDAAAFCGGTIASRVAQGWKVVLVRVTDDCRDAVGLTLEQATARNAVELRDAAGRLGVAEIVELGFQTDCLADTSAVALRERFVYLFRRHRPYTVLSFDPFASFEGNLDHVRVAQAVEEAFWVACFDLHHPEHFAEGLAPFSVCERLYFARRSPEPNHVVDITDFLQAKIDAVCAHATMMRNTINQFRLQLRTDGRRVPLLDACFEGDVRPMVDAFLRGQASAAAEAGGLPEGRLAEVFRRERFGDLEEMFEAMGEPIDG